MDLITTTVRSATAKNLSRPVRTPSLVMACTMSVVSTICPATRADGSALNAASRTARVCITCARPLAASVDSVG